AAIPRQPPLHWPRFAFACLPFPVQETFPMATRLSRQAGLAVLVATATLAGCTNYIKRDEFDATVAELRATDQQLASQIQALSDKHDALVTQLAGRTRLDTAAYFDFGSSTMREDA